MEKIALLSRQNDLWQKPFCNIFRYEQLGNHRHWFKRKKHSNIRHYSKGQPNSSALELVAGLKNGENKLPPFELVD
jgi:hypothetical protein